MKCFSHSRGFSLVELIVVIGIIATALAIVYPAFHGYIRNTNLRSAAREVASDIFFVREKAISENRRYRITFDVAANNYTIEQGTSAGGPYTLVQVKPVSSFGSDIRLTNAAFGGDAAIVFQTRGTAEAGSAVLTNSRGSTATVTTNMAGRTYVRFDMY
ncbi:MAG: GspH/FimT family pseudopilin [Syntrophales bacterium]